MAGTRYCVRWKNRNEHYQNTFAQFLDQQILCDVTLFCDQVVYKAHRFILAACSLYFKKIFENLSAVQHPVIFLRNSTALEVKCLLDYMYKGEAVVQGQVMTNFLNLCESLKIQGLSEDQNSSSRDNCLGLNSVSTNGILIDETSNCNPQMANGLQEKNNLSACQCGKSRQNGCISNEKSTPNNLETNYPCNFSNSAAEVNIDLSDLTEADLPNSGENPEKTVPNVERNILDSPPHSPSFSLDFLDNIAVENNVDNARDVNMESIILVQESNNDVIDISDDCLTPNQNTSVTNDNPVNSNDRLEISSVNNKKRTSNLDLRSGLDESDNDTDDLHLSLSPEGSLDNQNVSTDESEIVTRRVRRRIENLLDSDPQTVSPATVDQVNSNQEIGSSPVQKTNRVQAQRLQVLLQKISEADNLSRNMQGNEEVIAAGGKELSVNTDFQRKTTQNVPNKTNTDNNCKDSYQENISKNDQQPTNSKQNIVDTPTSKLDERLNENKSKNKTGIAGPSKVKKQITNRQFPDSTDGKIYLSVHDVPRSWKKYYCKRCSICIKPALWKKHIHGHSVKFGLRTYALRNTKKND